MANQKQLEILKQGVEVWNRWREENPEEEIDLNEADFRQTNLSEANLKEAKFWATDFKEAKLRETDLRGTFLVAGDLSGADLRETFLMGADLSGANLWGADLTGADLSEATLWRTNIKEADLKGAGLRGAKSLTLYQLSRVKTLYQAKLDPELKKHVQEWCPHLLEKPEEE
jgi:uncharacterized protein YjbI with pentapeptide repeats